MATNSSVAALTVRDTVGGTFNEPFAEGAALRVIPFTIEKVAGNTDGDEIQIARVRSNWSVVKIEMACDSLSGMTDFNLGLWTDEAAGTATDVDENVYADALNLNAGLAFGASNHAFTTRDIAKAGQKVWQDAGATSDTNRYYRIAMALITGGTAAGTISGFVHVLVPAS